MNFSEAVAQQAENLRNGLIDPVQSATLGEAVQQLADSIAAPGKKPTAQEIQVACKTLNGKRQFAYTRLLGREWSNQQGFDPIIDRHLAQALINLSALNEAEQVLDSGLKKIRLTSNSSMHAELPQYEGLLGRILKQRFVLTQDSSLLQRARGQYLDQYLHLPDRPYWHGINAIALRAREERDGVKSIGDVPTSMALATELYNEVVLHLKKKPNDHWALSTLSEASLALGECDHAERWLIQFLRHPNTEPFDIDSYQRQLREIWNGDPLGDAGICANHLSALIDRHLMETQSRWSVWPTEAKAIRNASPGVLERNFSGSATFTVAKIMKMLEVCASVGCVSTHLKERMGTGFLVKGSAIKEAFGTDPVFVTNAHVISENVPRAIRPEKARVSFELNSAPGIAPQSYEVEKVLFSSPPGLLGVCDSEFDNLDVSVVRLKGLPKDIAALEITSELPIIDTNSNAYVVGHPGGAGLQVSLHDSQLLDIDRKKRLVHYRTPTDPGSSGSPVFNTDWEVMALHHGGSPDMPRMNGNAGTYQANEGIALGAIMRCVNLAK